MTARTGSAARRWTLAASAVIAIYAFVPLALPTWEAYRRVAGSRGDAIGVVGLVVAAGLVIRSAAHRARGLAPVAWLALVIAAIGYAAMLRFVPLTPAEKTHFLTYGLLAWAAHRAIRLHLTSLPTAVATVVFVALAGWGDELIQAVLPNRYFEWKDVALNAVSGLLATIPVSVLRRDASPSANASP